jgi:hypothetical protein
MPNYNFQDSRFTFEGAVSVQTGSGWAMPWRIPFEEADFYPVLAGDTAQNPSGVRLTFVTDARRIELSLFEPADGMKLDLLVDGCFVETRTVAADSLVQFSPLPAGLKQVEIWLDPRFPFRLAEVRVEAGAGLARSAPARPRWVHYGSSISHSKAAGSPSTLWTGLVAQRLNLHLTNLGFSGQCKLDPMIGRLIRDLPADFISLKLGINIYNGDLTERTFGPCAIGLIRLIREKHPETPLAVISPIYSPPREAVKGGSGLSLHELREVLAGIVATCREHGDRWIHYVDGLRIFGPQDVGHLPDELHPDAGGQYIIAERIIAEVFGKLQA